MRKPIFEKLFSIAEYTNLTKEEKTMYDASLKYKWDNENVRSYALQEGRKAGITEGRKEGRKEGITEGKLEEARQIAGDLKKEGLDLTFIARITKLSIEEIDKL